MARSGISSRWLGVVALLGVLALGLGGGYLIARTSAGGGDEPDGLDVGDARTDEPDPTTTAAEETTPVPEAVAADARAAVEGFLDAEIERDFDASWSYLTADDQEELGPPAQWVNEHANFPPIEGYEIVEVREREGRVETVTELQLDSGLNEFTGLVPARAEGIWVTTEEGDGWRVEFTESVLRPRYPSAEDAPAAAAEWARAQQACEDPQPAHDGPLYGLPVLALELCGSEGDVGAGGVADLREGEESSAFVSAFGPEVFGWARVVPITGPVPIRVVLAPIDDQWEVIGVLRDE